MSFLSFQSPPHPCNPPTPPSYILPHPLQFSNPCLFLSLPFQSVPLYLSSPPPLILFLPLHFPSSYPLSLAFCPPPSIGTSKPFPFYFPLFSLYPSFLVDTPLDFTLPLSFYPTPSHFPPRPRSQHTPPPTLALHISRIHSLLFLLHSCCGSGYTSRWYHISDGEHFCNECFDHYYRR